MSLHSVFPSVSIHLNVLIYYSFVHVHILICLYIFVLTGELHFGINSTKLHKISHKYHKTTGLGIQLPSSSVQHPTSTSVTQHNNPLRYATS
jgi:hypothetical protein